jgi:predicted branched-subunit amino acid permease
VKGIVRDGIAIGVATGAYGVSFGALGVAADFSVAQTCAMSLLMFTGASQLAMIGVIGSGGSGLAGAGTALLLGARNAFYGLRLAPLLRVRGARRLLAAQLVIDESTGLALRDDDPAGFWAAGLAVFVLWNLGTLLGALGAQALPSPKDLGLDAAVPAAFVALLAPQLKTQTQWMVAAVGAAVALAMVPSVPIGVPVLAAALVAVAAGARKVEQP